MDPIRDTAQALRDYMDFRAAKEGQAHELTTGYYTAAINVGIRKFFGVTVDTRTGLISDECQPGFFAEWQALTSGGKAEH